MAEIEDLVELFSQLPDWEERYSYIIELGKKLPPFPDALRNEETKVKGCMSQVWLVLDSEKTNPNHIYFRADSDALIVKGLVALLLKIYNGRSAQEILKVDIKEVFKKLGLEGHLSPIRRNGFFSMVGRIQEYAQKLIA